MWTWPAEMECGRSEGADGGRRGREGIETSYGVDENRTRSDVRCPTTWPTPDVDIEEGENWWTNYGRVFYL